MRRFQPAFRTVFAVAPFVLTTACMPPSTRTSEAIRSVNQFHNLTIVQRDGQRIPLEFAKVVGDSVIGIFAGPRDSTLASPRVAIALVDIKSTDPHAGDPHALRNSLIGGLLGVAIGWALLGGSFTIGPIL